MTSQPLLLASILIGNAVNFKAVPFLALVTSPLRKKNSETQRVTKRVRNVLKDIKGVGEGCDGAATGCKRGFHAT